MKISSKGALALLATTMTGWIGVEAADMRDKASRVPALEQQSERNYEEIQTLRQQTTELLILVHTALGDIKRVAELRIELNSLLESSKQRKKKEGQ